MDKTQYKEAIDCLDACMHAISDFNEITGNEYTHRDSTESRKDSACSNDIIEAVINLRNRIED